MMIGSLEAGRQHYNIIANPQALLLSSILASQPLAFFPQSGLKKIILSDPVYPV